MRVCVYAASSAKVAPEFHAAARQLGETLAANGCSVVYGGGSQGLMGALANDGWLDGEDILSPALISELSRERIRGQDLVLPFEMSWGAGVMRNETVKVWGPGPNTFGHSGWGGSCAFADPDRRLAGAYVMNKQSAELIGDARSKRLIEAAYRS